MPAKGKSSPVSLDGFDLIVCDMAGTTVDEGGLVYIVLRKVMQDDGLQVTEKEMHPWHGAKKEAVIEFFAKKAGDSGAKLAARVKKLAAKFLVEIEKAYFSKSSPVGLIDKKLPEWIRSVQAGGTKVGFDTGYPIPIQKALLQKVGLDKLGDAAVSAYEVKEGRPYPYMVFNLMEKCGVQDVRRVAKIGDSVRDIEEGKNAGCGLVIGCLSGADTTADFMKAGADVVVRNIVDILPAGAAKKTKATEPAKGTPKAKKAKK
eukprot:NODE_4143_length_1109_cov_87.211968_g3947_i0.p1 GENE.NODE_4143_length_1109_cov_87.211968_g3947_i0~~NODE_4143_length_1109_cov_87.211968_g3947_i0.p1  ORF type:complete len:260 (+),score=88.63 NODE_4143_length_1109_cov_87.211968_g3947_i0:69-848(+)